MIDYTHTHFPELVSKLQAQKITQTNFWGIVCVMGCVWVGGSRKRFVFSPPTPLRRTTSVEINLEVTHNPLHKKGHLGI